MEMLFDFEKGYCRRQGYELVFPTPKTRPLLKLFQVNRESNQVLTNYVEKRHRV